MSGLFNRVRSGAGKAAFEADKLRRITAIQAQIRSLRSSFEEEFSTVGRITYRLFGQGRISEPELLQVCERMAAMQAEIQAREEEIQQIRQEVYVEEEDEGALLGRHICPNGHGPLPPQDRFCQICGAAAVYVEPPTRAQVASKRSCSFCGATVAAEARFCANCGRAVPVQETPRPLADYCQQCGTKLLPGAGFCAECGQPVIAIPLENVPAETAGVTGTATSARESTVEAAEPAVAESTSVEQQAGEAGVGDAPESVTSSSDESHDSELASEVVEQLSQEAWVGDAGVAVETPEAVEQGTPALDEETSGQEPAAADPWDSGPDQEINSGGIARESRAVPARESCPQCGASLLPNALFCATCGHRLEESDTVRSVAITPETSPGQPEHCPGCGAVLLEGAFFCAECGHQLLHHP